MATHWFNCGKQLVGKVGFDNLDVRVALLMLNTTADTDNDTITNVDDLTLDEFDGAGYSRKTLSGDVVNRDDVNDRAEYDANDVTWEDLPAGTRSVLGVLVFHHVTNDADSVPLFFLEFSPVKTPDGSDFTAQVDPQGLAHLT